MTSLCFFSQFILLSKHIYIIKRSFLYFLYLLHESILIIITMADSLWGWWWYILRCVVMLPLCVASWADIEEWMLGVVCITSHSSFFGNEWMAQIHQVTVLQIQCCFQFGCEYGCSVTFICAFCLCLLYHLVDFVCGIEVFQCQVGLTMARTVCRLIGSSVLTADAREHSWVDIVVRVFQQRRIKGSICCPWG